MAGSHGYTAGRFAIELGGKLSGFLSSVTGGGLYAEVIEGAVTNGVVEKGLGPRRYEPIVVELGVAAGPDVLTWIDDTLAGKAGLVSGAISMLDYTNRERQRLEWTNGTIDEIVFPEAVSVNKSPASMRITIRAESTRVGAGSNATVGSGISTGAHKGLIHANFQWSLSGLHSWCTKTRRVAGINVRRRDDDVLVVDDIEFDVPTTDAAVFRAWFDDLLSGTGTERTATLTFLDPSLSSELMRIETGHVGACRIADSRETAGVSAIATSTVTVYCESVALVTPPVSPPPSGGGAVGGEGAAVSAAVERLAGAFADALRAHGGTPPATLDTIAERLLATAEAPPPATDAVERGRAAGRAWASEAARLDELDRVAEIAAGADWTGLMLDDGHTLTAFLADRGVLDATDPPPAELTRDDFVAGLVAGAAEVHAAVAPLLVGRDRLVSPVPGAEPPRVGDSNSA